MSYRNAPGAARQPDARPLPLMRSAGVLLAALAAGATPAAAQSMAMQTPLPALWIRPEIGAYIPTGQQRDLVQSALLVGAQAQWDVTPRWALTGSYAWSPTHDRTTTSSANPLFLGDQAPLNVKQWDVGVQAYLAGARPELQDGDWYLRPFLGAGVGSRMYNYTETHVVQETVGRTSASDFAGYGAVGADLALGGSPIGLHLELRDNVSKFKGTYDQLASGTTRNDMTLAAGVNVGF
jgi:Outer membrane protein beta-barrel domain